MSEFNLIAQYFTRPSPNADLGVGDDAALIQLKPHHQLAISTDMSVAGTHFLPDCPAYFIGWKSLAVNISDMAAMGATPKWATLAIALPETNPTWLAEFSRGFFACADQFGVSLIGGDTTRGTLNISVQIMGEVAINQALRRDGAKADDEIWVSGTLGEAALGLASLQNKIKLDDNERYIAALQNPQPRVALGLALRGIANSAIDISDGLLADLGHILERSNLGATLHWANIPTPSISPAINDQTLQNLTLAGGDDYELCFTAPASAHHEILAIGRQLSLKLSPIGVTTKQTELIVLDQHQQALTITSTGYEHFN